MTRLNVGLILGSVAAAWGYALHVYDTLELGRPCLSCHEPEWGVILLLGIAACWLLFIDDGDDGTPLNPA